jgi:hypothetical protein
MTPEQKIGLGAIMLIGAVVVGYVVRCVVPKQHYPRVAGVLAANVSLAGLAVAGIEPAVSIIVFGSVLSVYAGFYAAGADAEDRR